MKKILFLLLLLLTFGCNQEESWMPRSDEMDKVVHYVQKLYFMNKKNGEIFSLLASKFIDHDRYSERYYELLYAPYGPYEIFQETINSLIQWKIPYWKEVATDKMGLVEHMSLLISQDDVRFLPADEWRHPYPIPLN